MAHKFVEIAKFYMTRQNQASILKGNAVNVMLWDLTRLPALAL